MPAAARASEDRLEVHVQRTVSRLVAAHARNEQEPLIGHLSKMLDGPTRRRIQEILDRTPGVTDMRDAPNTEYPWRDGELLHVPASASVFTSRGEEGLRGMVRIVTEVLVLFEELARAVERGRL